MSDTRKATGQKAEQKAVDFLTARGHTILRRNFRTRRGEIDIVSREKKCTVFTEVKFRASNKLGSAESAVTRTKQKKISLVAMEFLAANKLFDTDARFDVISIHYESGKEIINHIENAFDLIFDE